MTHDTLTACGVECGVRVTVELDDDLEPGGTESSSVRNGHQLVFQYNGMSVDARSSPGSGSPQEFVDTGACGASPANAHRRDLPRRHRSSTPNRGSRSLQYRFA
jgi:hypothetical protein